MDERTLIKYCRRRLADSELALNNNRHEDYCKAMSQMLDTLMVELVGGAPNETQSRIDNAVF